MANEKLFIVNFLRLPNFHKHTKLRLGKNICIIPIKNGGTYLNLQDFCWNWFEKSGHPSAYMEYLQIEQNVQKQEEPNEYF